jgi:hypothetical protein
VAAGSEMVVESAREAVLGLAIRASTRQFAILAPIVFRFTVVRQEATSGRLARFARLAVQRASCDPICSPLSPTRAWQAGVRICGRPVGRTEEVGNGRLVELVEANALVKQETMSAPEVLRSTFTDTQDATVGRFRELPRLAEHNAS